MSGTTPKTIPEINLDEFERRLRAAGAPSSGVEDPLAELTRLVNAVHSDARRAARPGRGDTQDASFEPADEPELEPLPAFAAPPRSSFAPNRPDEHAQSDDQPEFDSVVEPPPLAAPVDAARAQAPRSSGWTFKVVGLSVLGFALLVGAVAIKNGRVPGLAKAPPFIAADDAPTKVQPPNEAAVQSTNDIAGLLMKDSATPTPVKVVSNEEQPIDLRTQTQPAAPGADAAGAPTVGGSPVANAPDTPVVPPSAPSTSVAPLFPAAKPVKTVSVRPDGSLITDAAPPAPASLNFTPPNSAPPSPAPAPPSKSTARALDAPVAAPDAATPKLDIPTKLAPPKSAARVVAKTDTTAPADATDTTPSAPLQLSAPKPSKPAAAAPPQSVAEAAPTDVSAPMVSAAPGDATAAEGDGRWGVQLAAPHSAADAKSAISRLKSKYADALGDSELGVHEADVKGQTIYRVRVTGLSRSEAGALCAKLKAGGGDCFVAKD